MAAKLTSYTVETSITDHNDGNDIYENNIRSNQVWQGQKQRNKTSIRTIIHHRRGNIKQIAGKVWPHRAKEPRQVG